MTEPVNVRGQRTSDGWLNPPIRHTTRPDEVNSTTWPGLEKSAVRYRPGYISLLSDGYSTRAGLADQTTWPFSAISSAQSPLISVTR